MLDQDLNQVPSKKTILSYNKNNEKNLITQTPEKKKVNLNSLKNSFKVERKNIKKKTEEASELLDYFNSISIKSNISHKNKVLKKLETGSSNSIKLKEISHVKKRNTITFTNDFFQKKFYLDKAKNNLKKRISKNKKNIIAVLDNLGNELIRDISYNMNVQKQLITCKKENLKEIRLSRKNSYSTYNTKKEKKSKNKNTIFLQSFIPSSINIDGTIEKEGCPSEKSRETMMNDTITLLSECRLLIFHENYGKKIWDCVILLMVLYNVFVTPMYLTFYPDSSTFTLIEIIIELAFIIEIITNFFTTYRDEEENIISSRIQISLNYLFSWFMYDLLTSIPYVYLFNLQYLDSQLQIVFNDICVIKITIIQWIKMLKIIKIFRDNTGKFFEHLVLNNNYTLNRILKFLMGFCFLIHISTCFFVFLGRNTLDNLNWINKNDIDLNTIDLYIASLYYNLVTIYSIGYGDITPVNIVERMWVNILLMFGSILYSYTISSLSTIFLEESNKYGEFKRKMKLLDSIYEEYDLPVNFYYQLKQTLSHEYEKNENERYQFIDSLPSKIKNDLIILMYRETVGKNIFFKDTSNDFILYVLPLMKFHLVSKGDILISEENFVEEMYFVLNGSLSLNMGINYQRMEIWEIKKNQYFGDLLMKLDENSPYELTCRRTRTEVFVLKKEEYLKIKNSFSQVIFDILEESFKLYEQIDKKRQLFLFMNQFYTDPNEAMVKMMQLNKFLFETEFDDFYYTNEELIDANEFISSCDDIFINNLLEYFDNKVESKSLILENIQKFKKSSNNQMNFSCNALEKLQTVNKYNIDSSDMNSIIDSEKLYKTKSIKKIDNIEENSNIIIPRKKISEIYKNKRLKMKESFKIYQEQLSKNLNFSSEYDNLQREENLKNKSEYLFTSSDKLYKSSTKVKGNSKQSIRNSHISDKIFNKNKTKLFTVTFKHNLLKERSGNFENLSKVNNNFSLFNVQICSVESFSIIEGRFKQEEIIKIKKSKVNELKDMYSLKNKLSFKTSPYQEIGLNKVFNKNISFIEDISNHIYNPIDNCDYEKKPLEMNNYSINKLSKIYDYLRIHTKKIDE